MKQLSDWFRIKGKIEDVQLSPNRDERKKHLDILGKLLGDYKCIYKMKYNHDNKPREENK